MMAKDKKLQPVGEWLVEAANYIKDNLGMIVRVVGWAMLMYFGIIVLTMIVGGIGFGVTAALGVGWNVVTAILAFVGIVVCLVVALSVIGKMMIVELKVVDGPVKSARELWRQIGWKEGLSMYLTVFLTMLAIYTGFFLLIVPGFIFGTWLSLTLYVKLDRKVSALESMMLSRDYTKGYGWAILGRYLLAGLMMIVFVVILMLIYAWMAERGAALAVIGYIGTLIGEMLMGVWMMRLGRQLYRNLIEIKGELPLKVSGGRRVRYALLVAGPLVLGILATIILMAVNPAAQIKKAQEIQQEQLQNYISD